MKLNSKQRRAKHRARIITLDTLLPPKPCNSNCYADDLGFGEASAPYSRITMRGQIPQVIIPVFEGAAIPDFMTTPKTYDNIVLLTMSFLIAFAMFASAYLYTIFM